VYPAFGVLVGVGAVYALLQTFPAREVLKILLLPPVLVGGILVAWMYADMGDPGVKGWTLALFVLVVTGGLTWFIVQL
jgi:hypothetical protein